MLDWSDNQTYYSIRELWDEVKQGKKALLFWIGAGASAWCGYPLWDELANRFHSEFLKYESQYVKDMALALIESRKYPDLFQMCKNTNEQRYNVLLRKSFQQRTTTPVYQRFLDNLNAINPLRIVTTNIDDCLERNLEHSNRTGFRHRVLHQYAAKWAILHMQNARFHKFPTIGNTHIK